MMGTKDFFKIVYDPNGRVYLSLANEIDLKSYSGKRIAVDAMYIIYSAFLAFKDWSLLSDENGNTTIHINTVVQQIANLNSLGIQTIWVFDNRKLTSGKEEETEKRKILRQKYIKQDSNHHSFEMKSQYIEEIMELLKYCGIPYMEAPPDFEAEHIAATLCMGENPFCHAVLTRDSDALSYGAPIIIMPEKKATKGGTGKTKKKIYRELKLADILNASSQPFDETIYNEIKAKKKKINDVNTEEDENEEEENTEKINIKTTKKTVKKISKTTKKTIRKVTHKQPIGNITLDDLRYISVLLGNDFCARTKKLGPGTILWKYNEMKNSDTGVVLTEKQQFAYNIYNTKVNIETLKNSFQNYNADQDKFSAFLKARSFKEEKIIKLSKNIFT
ncbi:MAG: hypothetical protein KIT69_14290 [Propionibacteriaceae bacterium]|nr:hypothetical protein [Propionibacteriaceae bacterium]